MNLFKKLIATSLSTIEPTAYQRSLLVQNQEALQTVTAQKQIFESRLAESQAQNDRLRRELEAARTETQAQTCIHLEEIFSQQQGFEATCQQTRIALQQLNSQNDRLRQELDAKRETICQSRLKLESLKTISGTLVGESSPTHVSVPFFLGMHHTVPRNISAPTINALSENLAKELEEVSKILEGDRS